MHVCIYATCAECPWRPEEADRSLGVVVSDGCELTCGYLEPNLSPLSLKLLSHLSSPE